MQLWDCRTSKAPGACPKVFFRYKLPVYSTVTGLNTAKQKYVLCLASDVSDDEARSNPYLVIIESYRGSFFDEVTNNSFYKYAVPVDMNGNEITEIE